MSRLVPSFILKQAKANKLNGSFNAIVVSIDLIGFTAITQSFMQHSHAGVEALIDIINAIFTPAISALESRGAYVSGFAGDSFTAMFRDNKWDQALAAALEIKEYVAEQAWQNTEYGDLKLAVRIGIGSGKVLWDIIPNSKQYVYWYSGIGITKAVNAQLQASPNEVTCNFSPCHLPESELFIYEMKDDIHGKIISQLRSLPPDKLVSDDLSQEAFVPEALSQLHAEGEFRDALSCFVNLQTDNHELKQMIIATAIDYGAYVSHVDCTDKGWVMFVLFGAPKCFDRNQLRAVSCAMEMQLIAGEQIRIGLTEGRAYAGFVGSATRAEYTGMGNTVNLAARMMMKAKWGEVWIDKTIYKAVETDFVCDNLGLMDYKGYPHTIETYRLIGKYKSGEYTGFTNKLLGRNKELETLQQTCREIQNGCFGGVSYLYGTAGQGKSRLLYELKWRLGTAVQFLYLQSDSIHQSALNPFETWIKNEFTKGITGAEKARVHEFRKNWAMKVQSVKHLPNCDPLVEELCRIESIIAALVGLEWEESVYKSLAPQSIPIVTRFAIKSLIEIMCKLNPVVLVIEDIHWLDKESESVIIQLARNIADTPLKIIITSRFRDDGSKPAIKFDRNVRVNELVLDGLNTEYVVELMQEVLSNPGDEELRRYVLSSSVGNPFFVVQLSKYLMETGKLEKKGELYSLKESCSNLPGSVQDILIARIDRMESELKRMVHTASVLGCEFAGTIVCSMLNRPLNKLSPLSREAVQSKLRLGELELIWNAVNELNYVFSHILLRDAAYGMQLIKQLKQLHLLAAEAIVKLHGDDKAMYSQLAYHYDKAGDAVSAAKYYYKSGDYERDLYHFQEAMKYYLAAIALIESLYGDKHLDYAKCLARIGVLHWYKCEYNKSLPYFQQALSIQEALFGADHPDNADILNNVGLYFFETGDYEKALDYYHKALNIRKNSNGENHPDTASCLKNIGQVYYIKGDYETALSYYDLGLKIRINTWGENNAKVAGSYNDMANVHCVKGNYKQAMVLYEKALIIRKEVLGEKHPETAISLSCIGDIYSSAGLFDKAVAYYDDALSIRKNILGIRHTETAQSFNSLGIVYDLMGEFDSALKYFEQALNVKQEILGDHHIEVASVLTNIGGVYDHQGKYDLALEYHHKAFAVFLEVLGEKHSGTAGCLNNIGCAYENQGEYDEAMKYYQHAYEIYLEALGEKSFETSIALVNIGCIYECNKAYQTALEFYNHAFSIRQEVLGNEHPATQRTRNNITKLTAIINPVT